MTSLANIFCGFKHRVFRLPKIQTIFKVKTHYFSVLYSSTLLNRCYCNNDEDWNTKINHSLYEKWMRTNANNLQRKKKAKWSKTQSHWTHWSHATAHNWVCRKRWSLVYNTRFLLYSISKMLAALRQTLEFLEIFSRMNMLESNEKKNIYRFTETIVIDLQCCWLSDDCLLDKSVYFNLYKI